MNNEIMVGDLVWYAFEEKDLPQIAEVKKISDNIIELKCRYHGIIILKPEKTYMLELFDVNKELMEH